MTHHICAIPALPVIHNNICPCLDCFCTRAILTSAFTVNKNNLLFFLLCVTWTEPHSSFNLTPLLSSLPLIPTPFLHSYSPSPFFDITTITHIHHLTPTHLYHIHISFVRSRLMLGGCLRMLISYDDFLIIYWRFADWYRNGKFRLSECRMLLFLRLWMTATGIPVFGIPVFVF